MLTRGWMSRRTNNKTLGNLETINNLCRTSFSGVIWIKAWWEWAEMKKGAGSKADSTTAFHKILPSGLHRTVSPPLSTHQLFWTSYSLLNSLSLGVYGFARALQILHEMLSPSLYSLRTPDPTQEWLPSKSLSALQDSEEMGGVSFLDLNYLWSIVTLVFELP